MNKKVTRIYLATKTIEANPFASRADTDLPGFKKRLESHFDEFFVQLGQKTGGYVNVKFSSNGGISWVHRCSNSGDRTGNHLSCLAPVHAGRRLRGRV